MESLPFVYSRIKEVLFIVKIRCFYGIFRFHKLTGIPPKSPMIFAQMSGRNKSRFISAYLTFHVSILSGAGLEIQHFNASLMLCISSDNRINP
jgi:hypothetical protein